MALYEKIAEIYDELFPINPETLDFIEEYLPVRTRAGRALDAGSATGAHTLALARRGWEVLGLEPSRRMVEIARGRAAAQGLSSARFEAADMRDAGSWIEGSSLDLLLCLGNTLPHLPDIESVYGFLDLARDLLKPSGLLALQLVNFGRPDIGPGFAFPELRAGGTRFLRRYEEASDKAGKIDPDALAFVTELLDGSTARRSDPERDRTRLLAIRPPRLLHALREGGFSVSPFSSWEGADFLEARDMQLILLARPS
jgi:glycine/sarcosine N-methyltransferase